MCLAIYKPAGQDLPDDHLEEGFQGNPDGAGFAWVEDGRVRFIKGFFDYDMFIKHYRERVKPEFPAVIHFRWATVGEKNADNCHPFDAGNGGVLIHNGPQIQNLGNKKTSDSSQFATDVMKPLTIDTVKQAQHVLEGYLGFNKVVLLYPDDVVILNEKLGHWHEGVWYSNDGYRPSYSSYSWNTKRSAITQRHSKWDNWGLEDYPEKDEDGKDEFGKEQDKDLTVYILKEIMDSLTPASKEYAEKHVDFENYFYDNHAEVFFFFDQNYEEYIELSTGYSSEEYYFEIHGVDIDTPVDSTDEDPAPDPDTDDLRARVAASMLAH